MLCPPPFSGTRTDTVLELAAETAGATKKGSPMHIFVCIGVETGNEAEKGGEKCVFIGKFKDLGPGLRKGRGFPRPQDSDAILFSVRLGVIKRTAAQEILSLTATVNFGSMSLCPLTLKILL